MSRRRPLCAWCGDALRRAHIRIEWDRLPGRPEIGWHAYEDAQCAEADPLRKALLGGEAEVETVLAAVAARGPGRVARNQVRRPGPPRALPASRRPCRNPAGAVPVRRSRRTP